MSTLGTYPGLSPILKHSRAGQRRIAAGACCAVMVSVLLCGMAYADPAEGEGPIGAMMRRLTKGGSRSDLFDMIERNEAERTRQQAEREALEAEVRAIVTDIEEKIFAIRLNIAEIRNGPSACRRHRNRAAALSAQAGDLDRLTAAARARCMTAGTDAPAVAQLCRTRLEDITRQKAAVASEQAEVAQNCAETGKGDP